MFLYSFCYFTLVCASLINILVLISFLYSSFYSLPLRDPLRVPLGYFYLLNYLLSGFLSIPAGSCFSPLMFLDLFNFGLHYFLLCIILTYPSTTDLFFNLIFLILPLIHFYLKLYMLYFFIFYW